MAQGFLLGRTVLCFGDGNETDDIIGDLSAATFGPDGTLWLASDELSAGRITLSALAPIEPGLYGRHHLFPIDGFVELLEPPGKAVEADLEGLDFADGYLWFAGSHSSKRAKPKRRNAKKDLQRLAAVETELNRYLLGRIPLVDGIPERSAADPRNPGRMLAAARLAAGAGGNVLIEALLDDAHLGPFLRTLHRADGQPELLPLASKENGFDIEGLAVLDGRVFLGLRGPVLRGWAILLEVALVERGQGRLVPGEIGGSKRSYRKHFLDLDGLGIRDLARDGDDLLILAGPTMAIDGALRLFRLRKPGELGHDSVTGQTDGGSKDGRLTPLFDLPSGRGGDFAEGLAVTTWHDEPAVFVVYDGPLAERRPKAGTVFADVFRLVR